MRKKLLVCLWLLAPAVLLAYHYGPGQKGVAMDKVAGLMAQAGQAEAGEDWENAFELYGKTIAALPPGESVSRYKLRLAQARTRIQGGLLPEAMQDLENLLSDVQKDGAAAGLVREVRESLATSQYYAAWVMRLESATRDEWMPPVDQARQNFKLLAEQAPDKTKAADSRKNLEAAIRLARMDLSELQALPLPKECKNCKNCSQKCRKQSESQAKKKEEKEPKDARNAGAGSRPPGSGS
jgi:hypothetical protein